jgi:hypothetical protein
MYSYRSAYILENIKYLFSQRPANILGTDSILLEPGLDTEFHVTEVYSGLDLIQVRHSISELSEVED